jgi:hypothetical protein
MFRLVALVRTGVLEEPNVSAIKGISIGELGMLAVTSNQHMLKEIVFNTQ